MRRIVIANQIRVMKHFLIVMHLREETRLEKALFFMFIEMEMIKEIKEIINVFFTCQL